MRLDVPSLRERPEDIVLLAQEFVRRHGGGPLPEDVTRALRRHHWPGNVRELRNAVEAYLALGSIPEVARMESSRTIDGVLDEFVDPTKSYAAQKTDVLRRFTRAYLRRLLEATEGNQSKAARVSGLERSYLGKLTARLGLRKG